jgi:hypothetical protein
VEELKADLADVKQMYREQITMLVGQVLCLNSLFSVVFVSVDYCNFLGMDIVVQSL